MGSRARKGVLVSAVALVIVGWSPASAAAATFTIGSLTLPADSTGQVCGSDPCTVVQGQVSPASPGTYTLRAPADGTIVSWSYRNGNVPPANSYSLRVLRPANAQETSFTAVGTATSPIIPDALNAVRGPYAVSLPVRAGDRIGLRSNG